MSKKAAFFTALFFSVVLVGSLPGVSFAQAADNTGVNVRDRSQENLTSDQQGQSDQDVDITKRIREAINDDESLSTYAHNVKIITSGGMVILRGPVRSEKEKAAVEQKAAQIAGNDKVRSEIEIASSKGS